MKPRLLHWFSLWKRTPIRTREKPRPDKPHLTKTGHAFTEPDLAMPLIADSIDSSLAGPVRA